MFPSLLLHFLLDFFHIAIKTDTFVSDVSLTKSILSPSK